MKKSLVFIRQPTPRKVTYRIWNGVKSWSLLRELFVYGHLQVTMRSWKPQFRRILNIIDLCAFFLKQFIAHQVRSGLWTDFSEISFNIDFAPEIKDRVLLLS